MGNHNNSFLHKPNDHMTVFFSSLVIILPLIVRLSSISDIVVTGIGEHTQCVSSTFQPIEVKNGKKQLFFIVICIKLSGHMDREQKKPNRIAKELFIPWFLFGFNKSNSIEKKETNQNNSNLTHNSEEVPCALRYTIFAYCLRQQFSLLFFFC